MKIELNNEEAELISSILLRVHSNLAKDDITNLFGTDESLLITMEPADMELFRQGLSKILKQLGKI